VRADLNNALAAIATNNSSATAPTTTYAYQWWADTGSSPTVMKLRNAANSAWITLFQLDGEWSLIPFENGTAAAPSIYFKDSGTDTGLFSPGTDQVGITTGGSVRLTTSTTAFTGTLPWQGQNGTAAAPALSFSGDPNTGIYNVGADQLGISTNGTLRFDVSTTATTSTLPVVHPLGAAGTPSITFTGDLNTGIYSPAADQVAISTAGSQRITIDALGRFLTGSATSSGNGCLIQSRNDSTGLALELQRSSDNTNSPGLFFAKSRGTQSSPTEVLSGDQLGVISFTGYDGVGYKDSAYIYAEADADWTTSGDTTDNPSRLLFATTADGNSSPSERMRISSAGQVTVTVGAIVGFRVDTSTSAESVIITGSGSNLQIRHPAAGVELFNSSGNAIRVIANTGGVSLANGATAWAAISDERLKADLIDIEDGLNKTASLRAVTGRYIADESETRRSFLIAQDVEAVLPEAVESSNPDELGLRYTEVIPLLVAALKEAKERIETLEAEVAALKGA
jgi:hypothetical protein